MTKRAPICRRLVGWVGMMLSASCVLGWVISLSLELSYTGRETALALRRGSVWITYNYRFGIGWNVGTPSGPLLWMPRVGRPTPAVWFVAAPFWCALLPSGLLTALLWYEPRQRVGVDCGRCGYDLTGNVSGVCPECGTVIKQA